MLISPDKSLVCNEQIMTPHHETEELVLKGRFESAKILNGKVSLINETRVLMKSYTISDEWRVEIWLVDDIDYDVAINDIVGFVTCRYSDKLFVLGVDCDEIRKVYLLIGSKSKQENTGMIINYILRKEHVIC